ncbi:PEP-CTERM/exosortase system-associated acyltransferase [Acidovorax sp. LjRoot129]|uniref:PEP-CTERM/exosortase system-associated acyltransferase n=1 Tax=Acidovorax sp. LjRoot129 TaxID=3342260 RepID=UPI003ECF0ABB
MSAALCPLQAFSGYFTGHEISPQSSFFHAAQALRYQVYCEECGFLAPGDFPDRRERDEHDIHAAHFVALNRSDEIAGYVRLVLPDAIRTFPFQTHCVTLLDGVVLPPPSLSAEISRLIVRQDYRRRHGERAPTGVPTEHNPTAVPREMRNPSPQILLNLYREMYAYSLQHGIRYWYAAMERSLARMLARMNFGFQQIGPAIDYYGPVAPYVADLRVLEQQLGRHDPRLFAWMRSVLDRP